MAQNSELVVGLDIGTTKICAIVGEVDAAGFVEVVGVGTQPSRGLRKGVVINIDSTVASIRSAVCDAEIMAGTSVRQVLAGIAGGHVQGLNRQGSVTIGDRDIGAGDIHRALDAARDLQLTDDREVLHVLAQEFVVDQQDGIREPLGMSGSLLQAKVHVVTGSASCVQNLAKCAERSGLQLSDIVLEPLASSEAVLTAEEKDLGVLLVDMGGGTTDLALWSDGSIVHTKVLALGGDHITNDLAVGLRTPVEEAERLKRAYGCAMRAMVPDEDKVDVRSVGGREPRQVSRRLLAEIIEPRVEEILTLVQKEVVSAGCEDLLASGVVLTGGGTMMAGMTELSEEILGMPSRLGVPHRIGGLTDVVKSPMYATAVGLLRYGRVATHQNGFDGHRAGRIQRVKHRLRAWLGEIF